MKKSIPDNEFQIPNGCQDDFQERFSERVRTLDTPDFPDLIMLILSEFIQIQRDRIDRINMMKFICDFGIRHSESSIQFFHKF